MIVIIDYGLGNLTSVQNAFDKLAFQAEVSRDPAAIKRAKGIVLPGVGAAGQGLANLKERGLDRVITEEIRRNKPMLAICLGMQLLMSRSQEGDTDCLDLIKGEVRKFNAGLKVPQIGWNTVSLKRVTYNAKRLFDNIKSGGYFYFVNSYYCKPEDESVVAATTMYGQEFCSVAVKNNIFGVQFHPERSGEAGLQLIKNFADIVYDDNPGS